MGVTLKINFRFSALAALLVVLIALVWFSFSPQPVSADPDSAYRPTAWVLGPMLGWSGNPQSESKSQIESDINTILDKMHQYNVPLTTFHFDFYTWETCNNNGVFAFSSNLISRLRNMKLRAVFWVVPMIDQNNCPNEYSYAAQNNYFVTNSDGTPKITNNWEGYGSWIDFNNVNAKGYWQGLIKQVVTTVGTDVFGGLYLDDTPFDQNYAQAYAQAAYGIVRCCGMTDTEVIMKRYGNVSPPDSYLAGAAHTSYVGDLSTDFGGMQTGIQRVFNSAQLGIPAPFNEYGAYGNAALDKTTLIRRLNWGALQVVMDDSPYFAQASPFWPWDFDGETIKDWQYDSTLHWELVPYLHSYDENAFESYPATIFRGMNASKFSTQLGAQLFVNYVPSGATSLDVSLPAGQWINYWDEQQMFNGPVTVTVPSRLGQEPIFIANGAMIPMQVSNSTTGHGTSSSGGSLTVAVYPYSHSAFRYYDPTHVWVTFDSWKAGNTEVLCSRPAPSQSLIYRIARWQVPPTRVATLGGAVGVNAGWGTALPYWSSEAQTEASPSGWYYDAAKQHLIIKLTAVGATCPQPTFFLPSILSNVAP